MSEIDVTKCRYYLKDGSCSSMNEDCTKCVHNYCDWKVNQEQLQQLKQRLNEYEKDGGVIDEGQAWSDEAMASRVKLEKIKPILEYYANSKIGTLQDNGTYKIDCGGDAVIGSFSCQLNNSFFGLPSTFTYDPRPAKEGLKIIGDELITELQQLKAERDLLLGQLVVLDGEDVTVQVTQEQFEEYNRLKAELQAYKDKVRPVNFVDSDEYLKVVIENKQLKAESEELKEFKKLLIEQLNFNTNELELRLSAETKRSEFLLKEFKKADKVKDEFIDKYLKYLKNLNEIEEIARNFSCENCKEFSRCLEKRTQSTNLLKVELSYLSPNIEEINKIMQMIPSPTRCDVALEKVILQKIKEVKDNE